MTYIAKHRALTLFCACIGLSACGTEEQTTNEPVVRPVKMFTVGESSATRTLEYPGSVSAASQSDMAFEVPGRVIELPLVEGEPVKKGTVLARLDPLDYEAARDRAQAERDAARADFERYDQAFEANAVTKQDVDLARRNLDVAEANLQSAVKAVEDTILRAPFAGRLARTLVEDFANVQAKQTVLIVQSDDVLEMEINIPEADWVQSRPYEDVAEVNTELKPRVSLSALPGRAFQAQINAYSNSADPVTRTFSVTIGFTRPEDINISPGMTGHVVVEVPELEIEQGMYIPSNAVAVNVQNEPYVWLVDSDTGAVQRNRVAVGELSGSSLRILNGLQTGDRIAVSGVHTLTKGMRVRALER